MIFDSRHEPLLRQDIVDLLLIQLAIAQGVLTPAEKALDLLISKAKIDRKISELKGEKAEDPNIEILTAMAAKLCDRLDFLLQRVADAMAEYRGIQRLRERIAAADSLERWAKAQVIERLERCMEENQCQERE